MRKMTRGWAWTVGLGLVVLVGIIGAMLSTAYSREYAGYRTPVRIPGAHRINMACTWVSMVKRYGSLSMTIKYCLPPLRPGIHTW